MDGLPVGYTHRQKRSHAQMEAPERSVSPSWSFDQTFYNHEPAAFTPDPSPFHYANASSTFDIGHRQPALLFERTVSRADPPGHSPAPPDALPHPHRSGLYLPRTDNMPAAVPRRFAGDGFDYRRPAGSSARPRDAASVDLTADDEDEDAAIDLSGEDEVIDLTADDSGYGASQDDHGSGRQPQPQPPRRLPRGMDIIIDLDNGHEEYRFAAPAAGEPSSPEIEFISSRTLEQPRQRPAPGPAEDEVEFVEARQVPEYEQRRRRMQDIDNMVGLLGTMNGQFNHLQDHVARFAANINRTAANMNMHRAGARGTRRAVPVMPPRAAPRAHAPQVHAGTFMAPFMDFELVGFPMGVHRAPEPAPATYEAPSKAPDGFTRSAEEADVLVCPNCGDELCVGQDEIKSQVWIVKACGHVYCGDCTLNRSSKKTAKGKEKERPPNAPPFKACVVEDCGKNVTHKKSMFQIFL